MSQLDPREGRKIVALPTVAFVECPVLFESRPGAAVVFWPVADPAVYGKL